MRREPTQVRQLARDQQLPGVAGQSHVKNSYAVASLLVLRLEEVEVFISLGRVLDTLLAIVGWLRSEVLVLVRTWLDEGLLALVPTRVPRTRDMSSSPSAMGRDRGETAGRCEPGETAAPRSILLVVRVDHSEEADELPGQANADIHHKAAYENETFRTCCFP